MGRDEEDDVDEEGGEMMRKAVSSTYGPSFLGNVLASKRSDGISSIEHIIIRPSTFAIRDGEFFHSIPLLEGVELSITIRRTMPSRFCREAARRVSRCFQKRSGVRPCGSKEPACPHVNPKEVVEGRLGELTHHTPKLVIVSRALNVRVSLRSPLNSLLNLS